MSCFLCKKAGTKCKLPEAENGLALYADGQGVERACVRCARNGWVCVRPKVDKRGMKSGSGGARPQPQPVQASIAGGNEAVPPPSLSVSAKSQDIMSHAPLSVFDRAEGSSAGGRLEPADSLEGPESKRSRGTAGGSQEQGLARDGGATTSSDAPLSLGGGSRLTQRQPSQPPPERSHQKDAKATGLPALACADCHLRRKRCRPADAADPSGPCVRCVKRGQGVLCRVHVGA
mmetsp:Transcript_77212/g.153260  ORF Transcript_77212/g.153260 Transcript_77212/m.153260 type:complete len:232 (-) Transcript_77212:196-891(-)